MVPNMYKSPDKTMVSGKNTLRIFPFCYLNFHQFSISRTIAGYLTADKFDRLMAYFLAR